MLKVKDQGRNFTNGLKNKKKKEFIELVTEVKVKFSLVIFLFHESKKTAVLEPSTGHFGGLVGIKDKAKDFKMSPSGQGRSWGFHLWSNAYWFSKTKI